MNYSNLTSRIEYYNPNNIPAFNQTIGDYNTPSFQKIEEDRYRKKNKNDYNMSMTAMRGITTEGVNCEKPQDNLSDMFYSSENMTRIQKKIRMEVYNRTRGQFKLDDDQDESDLLVVMRAVFLEHARFLPFKIVHQIKELNKRVVEYIVPEMITEIKQFYGYLKEINEPLKPIDRPINVNNAGRKTLPSLTSVWQF